MASNSAIRSRSSSDCQVEMTLPHPSSTRPGRTAAASRPGRGRLDKAGAERAVAARRWRRHRARSAQSTPPAGPALESHRRQHRTRSATRTVRSGGPGSLRDESSRREPTHRGRQSTTSPGPSAAARSDPRSPVGSPQRRSPTRRSARHPSDRGRLDRCPQRSRSPTGARPRPRRRSARAPPSSRSEPRSPDRHGSRFRRAPGRNVASSRWSREARSPLRAGRTLRCPPIRRALGRAAPSQISRRPAARSGSPAGCRSAVLRSHLCEMRALSRLRDTCRVSGPRPEALTGDGQLGSHAARPSNRHAHPALCRARGPAPGIGAGSGGGPAVGSERRPGASICAAAGP